MKKKIAIFSDFAQNSGGAFHEASYLVKSIIHNNKDKYDFLVIKPPSSEELQLGLLKIKHINFSLNEIERYFHFIRNHNPLIRRVKKYFFFKNKFESFLKKHNVDFVFFPGPSQYSLYLEDIDFIITVPDVCHRENLEVPEWTKKGEFERREELLQKSLIKAIGVITNAQSIKEKLVAYYNLDELRVHVINQQPSAKIKNFKFDETINFEFKKKYNLPKNYLFYPAMYLPQKNHKYIFEVIKILKKDYKIDMKAVFCGVDKGYLDNLKKYSSSNNLDKDIFYFNYIEDKYLPYFYKYSFALAMPTLSGPTNLPVWEGFKMEKLVFYSNLNHSNSVYGDGPCYIDPLNPESMANLIKLYYENNSKKNDQILKGLSQFKKNTFAIDIKIIDKILENYFKTKLIWDFK